LFERLKPFLTGDEPESYAALGAELGVSEGSLRVAVHRLRRQFATVLREAIAETVEADGDVDEELRHLLAVVSR
jgi:RNA polymerase sigma-70 factor (ECF subfamily)